jgi:2'-5' RNA ligase
MSPLPTRMRNRWLDRVEPTQGSGLIYWHILMSSHSEARAAAVDAQESLAAFSGFHMTPLKWLHITTLIAGSTDEINRSQMSTMVSEAQNLLRDVDSIPVTVGRFFYHPEAIGLLVRPVDALRPIFDVAQAATLKVAGRTGLSDEAASSWTPHLTVSYSTADQPAEPIVTALGVAVRERQVLIDSLTLVIQWGQERLWNWEPVGTAHLRSF